MDLEAASLAPPPRRAVSTQKPIRRVVEVRETVFRSLSQPHYSHADNSIGSGFCVTMEMLRIPASWSGSGQLSASRAGGRAFRHASLSKKCNKDMMAAPMLVALFCLLIMAWRSAFRICSFSSYSAETCLDVNFYFIPIPPSILDQHSHYEGLQQLSCKYGH